MTYDLAPLFRTAIGFDHLARLVDSASQAPATSSYPPYNIEKTGDNSYVLTMALAGFGPDDIELTLSENTLHVVGRTADTLARGEMLHRGIASRAFERRFALADHIVIDRASLANGLLSVDVRRQVPEAAKPRRIPITQGISGQAILPKSDDGPHGAVESGAGDHQPRAA